MNKSGTLPSVDHFAVRISCTRSPAAWDKEIRTPSATVLLTMIHCWSETCIKQSLTWSGWRRNHDRIRGIPADCRKKDFSPLCLGIFHEFQASILLLRFLRSADRIICPDHKRGAARFKCFQSLAQLTRHFFTHLANDEPQPKHAAIGTDGYRYV